MLLARFRTSHDLHAGLASAAPLETPSQTPHASTEDLHLAAVRTLSLAQDLSNAVETNQFELFYQPLLALDGLVMTGYEALIRWRHPVLGLINPAEFIRERLIQYNMNPSELRIELTETVIIQNMEAVSSAVQQLRNLSTGVALDDFGTGYAGLDYLQTLPFTCLKIDRTFVQQIHQSDRSVHIIRAALELARSMGLSTITEGIEDAATDERLAAMGCSHAQGYYYARPMAKAQIAAWATAQQA